MAEADTVRADMPEYFFLHRDREVERLELTCLFEFVQNGASFRATTAAGGDAQEFADAAALSLPSGEVVLCEGAGA